MTELERELEARVREQRARLKHLQGQRDKAVAETRRLKPFEVESRRMTRELMRLERRVQELDRRVEELESA